MKIIRSLIWAFFAGSYLLFSLLLLVWAKILGWLGHKQAQRQTVKRFASSWSRAMLWATGSRVKVSGLENLPPGPVVVMGNHQGIFDIMLILAFIDKPLAFIAKIELARFPILSSWMKMMGCLLLDRRDIRQAVKIMDSGTKQIRGGISMVIFPEGTRSRTGELLPFRNGSLKLALRAQVPIVPVSIQGTGELFERHFRICPGDVKMVVGQAIMPETYIGSETAEISNLLRERIAAGLVRD